MKKVDFYVLDGTIELNVSDGGCSCSCSCSGDQDNRDSKTLTIDQQIAKFAEIFKDVLTLNTIHANKTSKDAFMNKLNTVFSQNNEPLSITKASYDFVIEKILPLVLVNDKIVFMRSMPNEEELYKAIQSEVKTSKKSSCCS